MQNAMKIIAEEVAYIAQGPGDRTPWIKRMESVTIPEAVKPEIERAQRKGILRHLASAEGMYIEARFQMAQQHYPNLMKFCNDLFNGEL